MGILSQLDAGISCPTAQKRQFIEQDAHFFLLSAHQNVSDGRCYVQSGCYVPCHGSSLCPSKRAWCWWVPWHISGAQPHTLQGREEEIWMSFWPCILYSCSHPHVVTDDFNQSSLQVMREMCWSAFHAMPPDGGLPRQEGVVQAGWWKGGLAAHRWLTCSPKCPWTVPVTALASCKDGLHVLLRDY